MLFSKKNIRYTLRVARGGCRAKAPPLAARPHTVVSHRFQHTGNTIMLRSDEIYIFVHVWEGEDERKETYVKKRKESGWAIRGRRKARKTLLGPKGHSTKGVRPPFELWVVVKVFHQHL